MTRSDLFERAKALWPEENPLGDAVKNGAEVYETPSLVATYDAIEAQIGKGDDWAQISAWAFHQALWSEATVALHRGATSVSRETVSFDAFDKRMRRNLQDASWSAELSEYLEMR